MLLEAAPQLIRLPAWSANSGKALVRSPKAQLIDSGLAAWLTGVSEESLELDRNCAGCVLAVEAKCSHTIRSGDARGLRLLRDELGDRFHRGVILSLGEEVLPFGEGIQRCR